MEVDAPKMEVKADVNWMHKGKIIATNETQASVPQEKPSQEIVNRVMQQVKAQETPEPVPQTTAKKKRGKISSSSSSDDWEYSLRSYTLVRAQWQPHLESTSKAQAGTGAGHATTAHASARLLWPPVRFRPRLWTRLRDEAMATLLSTETSAAQRVPGALHGGGGQRALVPRQARGLHGDVCQHEDYNFACAGGTLRERERERERP